MYILSFNSCKIIKHRDYFCSSLKKLDVLSKDRQLLSVRTRTWAQIFPITWQSPHTHTHPQIQLLPFGTRNTCDKTKPTDFEIAKQVYTQWSERRGRFESAQLSTWQRESPFAWVWLTAGLVHLGEPQIWVVLLTSLWYLTSDIHPSSMDIWVDVMWWMVAPEDMFTPESPGPVNITFYGKDVIKLVILWRGAYLGFSEWTLNAITWTLIREGILHGPNEGEGPTKMVADWSDVVISQ